MKYINLRTIICTRQLPFLRSVIFLIFAFALSTDAVRYLVTSDDNNKELINCSLPINDKEAMVNTLIPDLNDKTKDFYEKGVESGQITALRLQVLAQKGEITNKILSTIMKGADGYFKYCMNIIFTQEEVDKELKPGIAKILTYLDNNFGFFLLKSKKEADEKLQLPELKIIDNRLKLTEKVITIKDHAQPEQDSATSSEKSDEEEEKKEEEEEEEESSESGKEPVKDLTNVSFWSQFSSWWSNKILQVIINWSSRIAYLVMSWFN